MQSAMQSSLAKNIYPNESWHKSGFTIQTRTNEYMEQLPRFMTPNISLVIRRQNSLQRFLPQIQKPSQALQNIQYWEKWKICDSRWLIKASPILTIRKTSKMWINRMTVLFVQTICLPTPFYQHPRTLSHCLFFFISLASLQAKSHSRDFFFFSIFVIYILCCITITVTSSKWVSNLHVCHRSLKKLLNSFHS